jgi:hypothetical protein
MYAYRRKEKKLEIHAPSGAQKTLEGVLNTIPRKN